MHEDFLRKFCSFTDISGSLKILDNISVILSIILNSLGAAKGFINLITKSKIVFFNFTNLLRSSELRYSNMAALNWCIFGKIWLSVHQPVLKFWLSVAIAW